MLRRVSLSAAAVVMSALALLAAPASASGHGDRCDRLDPVMLPHTADSAQAWFDSCRRHTGVPRTADAAQAWLG
jgi:hypothetical protein